VREVKFDTLVSTVRDLCMDANYYIPDDVRQKIIEFRDKEESEVARNILDIILKNHEVSANEKMPICQDTGFAVFFIEMGEDVRITGGGFEEAIYEGVRQGYREGYLRKSIVDDPLFERKNTKDNTPPIIHLRLVPGDRIKIVFAPKGGGSENMSEVKMMVPADGEEGVKRFVVDRVRRSGGNPCPPVIVGVGIGGTFEHVAYLAKKALLRPVDSHHPDPRFAKLEDEILEEINKLGIGPMGLGGRTTALAVHIETHPCHIASMPVAVNMQCHAARHKEAII